MSRIDQSEEFPGRERTAHKNASFRVVALISAFNEGDIISFVIQHLVENGVEVYLLDNHSTDDTVEQASRWLTKGLLQIETFPSLAEPSASTVFDWGAILRRKEALAAELDADWFIHHDADEIREPPWPGMSLGEAIRWVDRLNYNTIDFRVINFSPVQAGFRKGTDPRSYFTEWEDPAFPDTFQLKCWKATPAPVSLASSGGHLVSLPGQRVFPIKFLLRHYPIRSQDHGRRKVFEERKSRFLDSERAIGWQTQYDSIEDEGHSFLPDPKRVHRYDADQIRLELMLRNQLYDEANQRAEGLRTSLEEKIAEAISECEKKIAEARSEREKQLKELAAELGRLDTEMTDIRLRLKEGQTRESRLVSQLEAAEQRVHSASRLEHDLRREIERSEKYRSAIEASHGWKAIQAVRRIFGRRW
jgi:hypothetical protein